MLILSLSSYAPSPVVRLCGAGILHLADYNPEVIKTLSIANVNANVARLPKDRDAPRVRYFGGDWASLASPLLEGLEKDAPGAAGYDLILTAETIYSIESQSKLIELFKKVLKRSGVVLLAAKAYYFGVGGSLRGFEERMEKDGALRCERLKSYDDGSSNLREVVKITWRE